MKFDGSVWSQLGSYTPTNWGSGTNGNNLNSLFVYKGKLYVKYVLWDSTNSYARLYVTVFSGSDLSQVYTYPYNSSEPSNNNKFHTNVVEYKGMAVWLEIHCDTNPLKIYECMFKIDNSGTLSFTRRISEFSSSTRTGNERSSSWAGNGCVPMLIPHRDRLAVVPNITTGHGYSSNERHYWAYNAAMEIDATSGVVTLTPFLTADTSKRYFYMDYSSNTPTNSILAYDSVYAHITSWKDYLYAITIEGKFYKVDPVAGTRTLIVDYSIDSNFAVENGQTYTTDNSNSGYTFSWASTSSAGAFTAPWQNWTTGAMKVKILNFNGTASNTKYAMMWSPGLEGGSWTGSQLYDLSTGAKLPYQPSGTQFQLFWTWNGASYNEVYYGTQNVYSVVYQNYLYIIKFASKRVLDTSRTDVGYTKNPPSVIIRYDGTSTPIVTKITNGGLAFGLMCASFDFDEAQGIVNVLGIDSLAQTSRHYKIYLGSTPNIQDLGTPYSKTDSYSGALSTGINANTIKSYDYGDVTCTIDSRVSDINARTITITYRLWGANSDTATIAVEHELDTGIGGWKTCSQKTGSGEGLTGITSASSSSGSTHTFVHDMYADYPAGYTGGIQHRIRIVSQTRN